MRSRMMLRWSTRTSQVRPSVLGRATFSATSRRRTGLAIVWGSTFRLACAAFLFAAHLCAVGTVVADDYDQAPIHYSTATPANCISQLQAKIDRGEVRLRYEDHFGYLRSVLVELGVPQSSQMLVFSKTSLQRERISPRAPRSLYFNDDVYVGFCQQGEVVEISAVDPNLGAVFYTLDQQETDRPRFTRHTDNCLICHASSNTQHVPGHLVRSVFSDARGFPILSSGTYRIDHTSPIDRRWGGWYVTGSHGDHKHLGNMVTEARVRPEEIDNAAGSNVTDLSDRLRMESFLTPHSDLVALMVLEHQAEGQNLLTRANFLTRQAVHFEESLNRELKEPAGKRWDSTKARIRSACDPLLRYLLFSKEAKLASPLKGTSNFADEFSQQGPRDKHGRSLRDFDLTGRMFKYPCSYLIYSASYQALPKEAKDYLETRLWDVLSGADASNDFAHLAAVDRRAIGEILIDTVPNHPESWRLESLPQPSAP